MKKWSLLGLLGLMLNVQAQSLPEACERLQSLILEAWEVMPEMKAGYLVQGLDEKTIRQMAERAWAGAETEEMRSQVIGLCRLAIERVHAHISEAKEKSAEK